MRYQLLLLFICFLSACQSKREKPDIQEYMTGNWFVIYPDEKLEGDKQEELYAKMQDSLVNERGLKMITCEPDGRCIVWDSTILEGRWGIMYDSVIAISCPGRGFSNFQGIFNEMDRDSISLAENVMAGYTILRLEWQCVKIKKGEFTKLFDRENNNWRIRPKAPESEEAMKKRLSAMLAYYSLYFKLISARAAYFIPSRVMLPVKFYQHAIGMRDFDPEHRFVSLFYSADDAKKAYDLLKTVVNGAHYDFPESDDKSFTTEYAYMLKQLSREVQEVP